MELITNIIDTLVRFWPYFLEGTKVTVILSVCSVLLGTIIGCITAMMRNARCRPVNYIAKLYVDIIRGTPLIVQLWIAFLQLPMLIPFPDVMLWGMDMSKFLPCFMALGLNSGAYVAEIIRAGILAVDKGQMEAARSLGMGHWMAMRLVIMPQAVKNIIPAIGNEIVSMIKETAIIQYLGVADIMYRRNAVAMITYNPLPTFYVAAIIYLALTFVSSRGVNLFERRLRKSDH